MLISSGLLTMSFLNVYRPSPLPGSTEHPPSEVQPQTPLSSETCRLLGEDWVLVTTWPHEHYLITSQVPHTDHNLNQTGSRAAESLWYVHRQTFPAVLFVGRENLIISGPTASVRYCSQKAHDLLLWRPLSHSLKTLCFSKSGARSSASTKGSLTDT